MKKFFLYLLLIIIVIISSYLYLKSPKNTIESLIISITTTSGILGIVIKVIFDQISLNIKHELKKEETIWNYSLNSKIGYELFEKYFVFGQEYINITNEISNKLFKEGPTDKIFDQVLELSNLRKKNILLIDESINTKLKVFEHILFKISFSAKQIPQQTIDFKNNEIYNKFIENMYKDYEIIMNNDKSENEKEHSINNIIDEIKKQIGADKIIKFKNKLLK